MDPNLSLSDAAGRRVLFATILASAMAFIDGSALNVALAALQDDLGASGVELLWIINGYLLLLASMILIGGALGDRYGRKRIFGTGIGVFAVASLACGFAPTTGFLIGARIVQGAGGALMVPGSLALLSASLHPDERGRAIGFWSSATTITTIGGPLIGGVLADNGLWRAVFFINLPLAAIALIMLAPVPETHDEEAPDQLDYLGAALTVIGLGALTFGLIRLGELGLSEGLAHIEILIALIGGVLALLAFTVVEATSSHPLIRLDLFQSRSFSGANLMTGFLYAALIGGFFFLPLNLIQVQGYDASLAGLTFLPFSILLATLSPWAGGMVKRRGPRLLLTLGPIIVGFGYVALSLPGVTEGPSEYWTTYFPGTVLVGLGMAITVAPLTTTVMGSVSSHHAGIASGINNAVSRSAGVMAIAAFGAIALALFSAELADLTAELELTDEQQVALNAEQQNLGDAVPPDGLDPATTTAIERAIDDSFVAMFSTVSLIAAGMCWLSALLAWLTIETTLTVEA